MSNRKTEKSSCELTEPGYGKPFMDHRQNQLRANRLKREAEGGHEVDRELTPEQIARLPAGGLRIGSRSATVWVQYFHGALGWAAARGYYSVDTGCWVVRYSPQEAGNHIKQVDAIAWAEVQPEVRPWSGLIVGQRLEDCRAARGGFLQGR